MIPSFDHSGVIPPFTTDPTNPVGSPYTSDLCTLIQSLGGTVERRALIQGLLNYRTALRTAGITSGFQLLDGSFTEDCEKSRGRAPSDIDLVTFAYLPVGPHEAMAFGNANIGLFSPAATKATYFCDAYFIDLAKPTRLVVDDTFYWYGLFSHQKSTYTWKGMLRIPLMADDAAAQTLLTSLQGAGNGS